MRVAHRQFFLAELDGHVQADGRQLLGQHQIVGPRRDFLALLARNAGHVGQDVLHRTPFLHQLARDFLADTRHAGDIVRRIAPQGQDVAHEHRVVDAVLLADGRRVYDFDSVRTFLLVNLAVVAHQLAVVLVGRHHIDVVARVGTLLRKGPYHVVGLVARHLQNRDAHRLQHPLDIGHRKDDVLGRFAAVGLVVREDFAAEAAPLGVERHAQQIRALALENVAQKFDEPEHHRGIHPRAVTHRASQKCVVVLEHQRVCVDQKQFFHIPSVASRLQAPGRLSSANHSAKEVAVSCRRSDQSCTPCGSRAAIRCAKSASMFSQVGW